MTDRISKPPATAARTEEQFPTLTEVMSVPRYPSSEIPDSIDEVDWPELAARVRENVLERMMRRSEVLLEGSLDQILQNITNRAAQQLAVELQDALGQVMRDVVARAVNEELTRLQTDIQKKKSKP